MKILMATDGSAQAMTAMRTASRLLSQNNDHDQIDLLCVAPRLTWPIGKAGKYPAKISPAERMREECQNQIGLEARKILVHAQSVLATEGIEADTLTEVGSAAEVIVQTAGDYDLTVIGAHDRYQRSKPGLGPVAGRVVARAPGAVLVGRDLTTEKSWRILIGVDGSLASEQAIRLMASCFKAESAEITLMHVVETPWVQLGLEKEWLDQPNSLLARSDSDGQIDHELWREAEGVIEDARYQLERLSLNAETMIEAGDPALEILSEAEKGEYDLIVLGATGDTGLKHSLLGSVSTKVAQNAPCSVFIVKFME